MILGSGLIQAVNTFLGAYDAIPSIAAAYSTRRLLTSYTGPLLRLVADRTGYPEQDIGYTAAGDMDTAAATSFLSGDAGYVTKWYDQSGNKRDAAQATLANMPLYVASGISGLPSVSGNGTSQSLRTPSFSLSQPISAAILFERKSAATSHVFFDGVTNRIQLWLASTSKVSIFAGSIVMSSNTTLIDTPYVISAVVNGASSEAWRNGVSDITGNPGANNLSGGIDLFWDGGMAWLGGYMPEIVVGSGAWDTSTRQAAEAAMNAYWSVY